MKVLYEDPRDRVRYCRWCEGGEYFSIWYEKEVSVYSAEDERLPEPLRRFLEAWCARIEEYKKTYREAYPVKMAKIKCIYEDEVYTIYPSAVSATYETDFMSDKPYTVSWDSLFEAYQREIRDDMKETLGIERSCYFGLLD